MKRIGNRLSIYRQSSVSLYCGLISDGAGRVSSVKSEMLKYARLLLT